MKQYIVDAFTDRVFHGNPAAFCVLEGDRVRLSGKAVTFSCAEITC